MKVEILYCKVCDFFTLKKVCQKCGGFAVSTKPARFSPEDKYGKYRRLVKQESL